jgi:type I restriction enzyme S subunit
MDMNEYVYWFFKFAAKDIDQRASGTTFKEVSGKIVGEILIPVPPLNEQKRIVAKVDELMALCDDLEARKQKTRQTCIQLNDACIDKMLTSDEPARFNKHWQRIHTNFDLLYSQPENVNKLRQAILQLAVQGKLVPQDPNDEPASVLLEKIRAERNNYLGKKALKKRALLPPVFPENLADCIPESWVFDRFGNLAMISGGLTLGRKLSGRKIGVFQYLRVANVQRWYVDLSNVKKVEVPLDELEKYKLLKGDILITEGGDWDKVGRAVIWENQIENCLHQNHIFKARFFNGMLYREWIVLFLNSPTGRSYFAEASKQTTNLASINMTQLRNCVLPIPPLNEQKRIVAKVDQLMALCDDLEAKLQKSQKRNDRLMEAAVAEMLAA